MTRLELAKEIYRLNVELGIIKGNGMQQFVRNALKGCGAVQAMRKDELQRWYDRLVEDKNNRVA